MQAIGVGQTNSAAGALPGTAESRTLLVALRILRDEVYSQHPEETTNGEWLTPQELDALIKKLEG